MVTPYLVVPDADAELKFLAAFGASEQVCRGNRPQRNARGSQNRRFAGAPYQ
jgi:hypothetical protein